jgi:hypothetical protein
MHQAWRVKLKRCSFEGKGGVYEAVQGAMQLQLGRVHYYNQSQRRGRAVCICKWQQRNKYSCGKRINQANQRRSLLLEACTWDKGQALY